jgi:YHS domain-containing protein
MTATCRIDGRRERMSESAYNWQERQCPVCGKTFIATAEWVYRRGGASMEHIFCSYKCLRKFDGSKPTKAETRERVIQAIKDGLTTKEICLLVGTDYNKVLYWRKKLKEAEKNERETEPEKSDGVYCGP